MEADLLAPARNSARGRLIVAMALVLSAVAIAMVIYSASPGGGLTLLRPHDAPLSNVLAQTVRDSGLDAGLAQYRRLRAQGFPQLSERESDLNDLGYQYLGKGDAATAIRVFQLNLETHPRSANLHDSLGEAYAKAGQKESAVAQYRAALALEPNLKSSSIALARLTGVPRKPYAPLLLFHIVAGCIAVGLGFAALLLRKGSSRHRIAGVGFSLGMFCMCAAALVVAVIKSEVPNIFAASLAFYLVATSWRSVGQRRGDAAIDWMLLMLVLGVAGGEIVYALEAAGSPEGTKDGFGPVLYVSFGALAMLCAVGDIDLLVRGARGGVHRIQRHLWRMCVALFIATASALIGQEQAFPEWLRDTHVLRVVAFAPLVLMCFWVIRTRGDGMRRRIVEWKRGMAKSRATRGVF